MSLVLRHVLGSFRVLKRRAVAVGRPALGVWADTGEAATVEVSRTVTGLTHANECAELDLGAELRAMLADGKIDREEFKKLLQAPGILNRCGERSHDIGEAVKL